MKRTVLIVALLASSAHGGLDKIDANGVTTTGGSASYANMIPLTGPDGKLSMSLLPPVADWASQPISNMYYVAQGSADGGNGSPQHPFSTLQAAASASNPGSSLLLAPGSYSGPVTAHVGGSLTLFGYGPCTKVTSMLLVVSGNSGLTEVNLVNLDVLRLVVSGGGTVNIRLRGACIGTLSGTLGKVTVTREDMCARVSAASGTFKDTYTGYASVSNAFALVNADMTASMTLSDGRAYVGDETVAYRSDLPGLTNAVYVKLAELAASDTALGGRITSEETIRTNADIALSQAITNINNSLTAKLTNVGAQWNTQFSTAQSLIGANSEKLAELWDKETNDVAEIRASVSSVPSAYAAADLSLAATLRSEFSSEIATVNGNIASVAQSTAAAAIADARASIVSDASSGASSTLTPRVTALEGRASTLEARAGRIETNLKAQSNRIVSVSNSYAGLVSEINALRAADTANMATVRGEIGTVPYAAADTLLENRMKSSMESLSNSVNAAIAAVTGSGTPIGARVGALETTVGDYGSVKADVSALKSWKTEMTTWKSGADTTDRAIKDKINAILTWLYTISNKVEATGTLPAKFP